MDCIVSYGPWFTAGHIDTRGDDSITHATYGGKLCFLLSAKSQRGGWGRILPP